MIKINLLKPSVPSKGGASKKKSAVGIMPVAVIALLGALGYGVYYMMSTDMFADVLAKFYERSVEEESRFTKAANIGDVNLNNEPSREAGGKSAVGDDNNKESTAVVKTAAAVKPEEKPTVSGASAETAPVTVASAEPIAKPQAQSLPAASSKPVPVTAVSEPVAKPVPEPKAPEPAPKVKAQSAQPSSLVRTHMIENVVRELGNESRAVKKFDAAYEDMSAVEKINYEVLFARNAFELITRSVPPGVRLRTIEMENFRTIYTSGVSSSKEMVEELFSAFRSQKSELLPKPSSHIKDNAGGGFQFVVTAKPRFGLELDDPFQALDHLGFKESLTVNLRKLSRLAAGNNFKLKAAPSQIAVDKIGGYRRVVYRAEGESTYRDFHKFVLALYDEKVPCAFRKVTLSAKNGDVVSVGAEILFTVKE